MREKGFPAVLLLAMLLLIPNLLYGDIVHQGTEGDFIDFGYGGGTLTWYHDVATDNNTIVIVTVSYDSNSGASVSDVHFGPYSMVRLKRANAGWALMTEMWIMLSPPLGTSQVTVTFKGTLYGILGRSSVYSGVNQFHPVSASSIATGRSQGPATITLDSGPGEVVVDAIGYRAGLPIVPDPYQTERFGVTGHWVSAGASEKSGSASVTMDWTLGSASSYWALTAASLVPETFPLARSVSVRPDCTGHSDCYPSLQDALTFEAADLVSIDRRLEIELYAMDDLRQVDTSALPYVTDANHYIRIYTPPSERHSGVWDDSKYLLEVSPVSSPGIRPFGMKLGPHDIWIDGIQLRTSSACQDYPTLVVLEPGNSGVSYKFTNSLFRGNFQGGVGSDTNGFYVELIPDSAQVFVQNSMIYDLACSGGMTGRVLHGGYGDGQWYFYNNTFYNTSKVLSTWGLAPHMWNNIGAGLGSPNAYANSSWDSDYNTSNLDEANFFGSHSIRSSTPLFRNEGIRDLRLDIGDAVARGAGSPVFSGELILDIVGTPRLPTWDIGANQAIPVSCSYALDRNSDAFPSAGGIGSFNVSASPGCQWSATSDSSWIHLISYGSGIGNGTVSYSVDPNPSNALRTGSISAAGESFGITEAGIPQYLLTVTKSGSGSGSVTSSPFGIQCDGSCPSDQAPFIAGTQITLTAVENAGSIFTGWSGACTGTGTCAVSVNGNTSVVATFDQPNGTGTVVSGVIASDTTWSCPGSPYTLTGAVQVEEGVTLTIERCAEVIFESGAALVNRGTILSTGTGINPVVFQPRN